MTVQALVEAARDLPLERRVEIYNEAVAAFATLVADVGEHPALAPQVVAVDRVRGNTYNPNHVAPPEMDLLQQSIEADGVTMPIVVMPDGDGYTVIDGFHRHTVVAQRLGYSHLPCAVIDRPLADRMASTVRHNRARGKHGVESMAKLVRELAALGRDGATIAEQLGMSEEELLRLCQMTGAAAIMAGEEYSLSWGPIESS